MGTNTLTNRSNGQTIDESFFNDIHSAINTSFVGRNSSGAPTSGQNLGTAAVPWGAVRATSLVVNGQTIDAGQIAAPQNIIVSGQTTGNSEKLDFIRASGSGLTATIQAATTNLNVDISGTNYTIETDISLTGLTAAPSTNNTCLINDTEIVNDKTAGEVDAIIKTITIDTVGSEISSLVGEWAVFKGSTEIFLAYVKSATELTNVFRGFFLDSSGNPIDREALNDNDTLTLLKLGWVFVDDSTTTADVTYTTPSWSFDSPSSPSTGDYWLDLTNQLWKRYDGTSFETIGRTLVGYVIQDDTNCVASRSLDKYFTPFKNVPAQVEVQSTEIIRTVLHNHQFQVWGNILNINFGQMTWNITTDLESGLTEAASTEYYLYLTEDGQTVISDRRPNYRAELSGHFHPHESWFCVGASYNDSSSDLINSRAYSGHKNKIFFAQMTGNSSGTGIKTDLTIENLFIGQRYLVSIHHGVQWNSTAVAVHAIQPEQNSNRIALSRCSGQNNSGQRQTQTIPFTPFNSQSTTIEFDVQTATSASLHVDTYVLVKEDFEGIGDVLL